MNLEEIKTLAEAGNAEAQANLAQRGVICHDIASAWKWANLSAAQNCPFGLYMLGLCYVNGYNTDQDLDKAQQLFQKSADMGCIRALTGLATVITYREKDVTREAFSLIRKAADEGDAKGLVLLAKLYKQGAMVVPSYNKALSLLIKSAEQHFIPGVYELACYYLIEDAPFYNLEKGMKLMQEAFDAGYSDAEGYMGHLLQIGKGVEKDEQKAFQLFQLSASKDNASAFLELGDCFLYGKGIKQDYRAAEKFYRKAIELSGGENDEVTQKLEKAVCNDENMESSEVRQLREAETERYNRACEGAEKGIPEDLYQVGKFNLTGKAGETIQCPVDTDKAMEYIKKAAEAGYAPAAFTYGILLKQGYGIELDDIDGAMYWYRIAAEGGDTDAMIELALCHQRYTGDVEAALEMLNKAADAGSAKAMGMLSYHYEYGLGVTQDDNKAFELAKLSAEAGDDEGEKMLGICYLEGKGVEQNIDTAEEWFVKAVNNGNDVAMWNLALIYLGRFDNRRPDCGLAMELLQWSAQRGNTRAVYEIGNFYYSIGDMEHAREALGFAAQMGYEPADEALKQYFK